MIRKNAILITMLVLGMTIQAQTISVDNISVASGESATIGIKLKDGNTCLAAGFTIALPEGITLTGDATVGSKNHIVRMNQTGENTTKVAVFSLQNKTFDLKEDVPLMVGVKAEGDKGTYQCKVTGIEFSSLSDWFVSKSDVSFDMSITEDSNGINTISVNQEGKSRKIYSLTGQRLNRLKRGVNIVDGKKVIGK